ncbi:MAG: hypothetical protein V4722_02975 [Bacteroidota bacterium]
MRFTATTKRFLLFVLGLAALTALVLFVINYYPNIASHVGTGLMAIFICFLIYVVFAPLFHFLGERADSVMAVYPDTSGKGLHIFSSFSASRGRFSAFPLRSIQYYFLVADTRKLLYTVLLKHNMEPVSGRSGYEGFSSLEETVLQSQAFKDALKKYSAKAGWELQLSTAAIEGDTKDYATKLNGDTYQIEFSKGFMFETLWLCCYDAAKELVLKKKL